MLEKVDLNRKMGKKEYKEWMDDLQPKLSYLQRACKEQKIPVMIVFEGFGAAGKGTLINKIIEPLDPRGFPFMLPQWRPRKRKCIRSCGVSGRRFHPREELQFLTEAGTGECWWTALTV